MFWQFCLISVSFWHLHAANTLVHYFTITYLSLHSSIALQFVAAETNGTSNILFTFNIGDQDHDSFFSNILLENTDNQIPIAFDQATPSKKMAPTTKTPSSIIKKTAITKKKNGDQLATNHSKQEFLH